MSIKYDKAGAIEIIEQSQAALKQLADVAHRKCKVEATALAHYNIGWLDSLKETLREQGE